MDLIGLDEIENFSIRLQPIEIHNVKEVDRKLSRPFIKSSAIVCDVGGHLGFDALVFAKLSSCCVLVDTNLLAVKGAKTNASKFRLDMKMGFVRGSATDLPFRDEVFDVVTSFSVLDHIPNKHSHRQAIKEMSRTTRKFGYVVVTLPNKLCVIKPFFRKIIQLMGNPFLEKHFTPKELRKAMISAQLKPLIFDSKYPTKMSHYVLSLCLPKFVMLFPKSFLSSFLRICEKVFRHLDKSSFKCLGPRMGYTGQKTL